MEKELKLYIPESLFDVNLAAAMLIIDIIEDTELSDMDKAVLILASMSDVEPDDVKKLPIKEIDRQAAKIIDLFTKDTRDYDIDAVRRIQINGNEYALEPNFDKMETGAFIDATSYLDNGHKDLHKLMAVIYRPIKSESGKRYKITPYSTEDDLIKEDREQEFLKNMPYAVVRASANFMLGALLG